MKTKKIIINILKIVFKKEKRTWGRKKSPETSFQKGNHQNKQKQAEQKAEQEPRSRIPFSRKRKNPFNFILWPVRLKKNGKPMVVN